MRGLFGDALALQSAQAANILLSFATFWILGNALSTSDYGIYSLIISLVSYLFVLTGSWNSQGFVRFAREEFVGHGTFAAAARARAILVGAASALCLTPILVAPKHVLALAAVPPGWLALVIVLFALQLAADALTGGLQSVADFRGLARFQVLEKAAVLLAVAAAWGLPGSLTVGSLGIALVVGKATALIVSATRLRFAWFRRSADATPPLGPLWAYSSPLLLSAVIGYFPLVAGPSIVSHFLSAAEVGKYNVAYQLYGFYQAMTASVVATLFVPLLTDLVTGERAAALRQVVGRFLAQLVVLNHLVVAGLSVATVVGLPLLLPKFADSTTALVVLLAGTGFQIAVSVYTSLLAAFKVSRPVALINVGGGVLFLVLYAVLVPRFGILALAGVWTGWYALSAPLFLRYLRAQNASVSARDLIPALLSTLALLAAVVPQGRGARVAVSLGLIPVILWAARRGAWFQQSDLAVLEKTGLPPAIRSIAARFYRWMDIRGERRS